MKACVVSGGSVDPEFASLYIKKYIGEDYILVAADAGYAACKRVGLKPDISVGDFDTLERSAVCGKLEVHPAEKDETDTELAIAKAIELGASEITLFGGTGTRLDHVLGNIELLLYARRCGAAMEIVDRNNRVRLLGAGERLSIKKEEQFGTYVSVIPFAGGVSGIALSGFKYSVENFTLKKGVSRGLSNEISDAEAQIFAGDGDLIIIESRD